MIFYGYVDNGETFVKAKITAESAAEALKKLEKFAEKVEERSEAYRGKIECLQLRDENNEEIWQTGEDDKRIEDFDSRFKSALADKIQVAEAKGSGQGEVKFVLTARSMFNDSFSQRTSFLDETYSSFDEAQGKCREFQKTLASHMRAGIEEVKFPPGADPVKTGSYWELHRGQFEKKTIQSIER